MNRRADLDHEPRLGDLEGLEPATRSPPHLRGAGRASPTAAARRPRSRLGALALVLLAAVAAAAWLAQDRLRALLPEPAHTAELAAAEAALAAGRLAGSPDAALESFQRVLAGDPDNERARAGVQAVGRALIARAEAALASGQLEAARSDFELAQRVLLGGDALDALGAAIEEAERRRIELEPLLARALAAKLAGRLSGRSDAAAELFQQALRADPDNALAKRGLADVADALGQRAGTAIAAGRLREAERDLGEIARIQPEWPGLPELRARLAAARLARPAPTPPPAAPATAEPASPASPPAADREPAAAAPAADVTPLLDAAEALLAAGRIDAPDEPNARALFERALALDPGNARARRGLARVGAGYLLKARIALEAGDLDGAAERYADAERAGADPDELAAFAMLLREAEEASLRPRPSGAAAGRDPRRDGPTGPTVDAADVERLLARGEAALDRGDLVEPPGDSALDLFRQVLLLDPDEPRARAGLAAIGTRARERFDEAVYLGRLAEAERHLDAVRAAGGSPGTLAAMQRELAAAWLDEGERLLGERRLEAAARAAARAREIDPALPGLDDFERRLGQPDWGPL
jgi:tetratricopeptide (TPR) repeat protein